MTISTVSFGAATYDVYGTPAELTSYAASSLLPAGVTFTTDGTRKKQLLVTATRVFERLRWAGNRVDDATPQPLAWPRTGLVDREGQPVNGTPGDIFDGFFELAVALDRDTTLQTVTGAGGGSDNVRRTRTRRKVGDLETEDELERWVPVVAGRNGANSLLLPKQVYDFIAPYLGGAGATVLGGLASGTDRDSLFDQGGLLSDFGFDVGGPP